MGTARRASQDGQEELSLRLENLRVEERPNRRRVAATVVWENVERAEQVLYFEAPYPFAADLEASPDAFVLASMPFAVWLGEKRIQVEGTVCTRLRDGLQAAMAIYARWYKHCRPLAIDPTGGFVATRPRTSPRTASFLSGGVDGLAVLRSNRLDYPRGHPESISSCLLLFGANDFELTAAGPVAKRLSAFERLEARLAQLAEIENFDLIPIHTSSRLLSPSYFCWTSVGFGAANVAVAHTLSKRVTKVLFASDGAGACPSPGASHPLLDQHFSTAAVHVQHEHAALRRQDKLLLLSSWPPALELMQPCHYIQVPPDGRINCGRCEKCIRTMLGLLALGKLSEAKAFVEDDVTPEMIRRIPVHTQIKADLLTLLIEPLQQIGRRDLVRALRRKITGFRLNPRRFCQRR